VKEFNVAQCPVCGSWNTENVNKDYRLCNLCGVAWDREYMQDGKLQIHKNIENPLIMWEIRKN